MHKHCNKNKIQLICFPYAGGCASAYRNWKNQLEDIADIYAVQLPGHESRFNETLINNMDMLIQKLYKEIGMKISNKCVFFGHSIGARIAYEFLKYYENVTKNKICHMIVSGSKAPHFRETHPIHNLSDDDFIEEIKRFKCTPKEILSNTEILKVFLPMLRADFQIDETYMCTKKDKINCPITVFGGKDDMEATKDELNGWREYTYNLFDSMMFDGEHFFIKTNEYLVIKAIRNILNKYSN